MGSLKTTFSILLLLFICCNTSFAQEKDQPYVINVAESIQSEWRRELVEQVFTDIYGQIGITPDFVFFPSLRGLKMVDEGILSAEAWRVEEVGAQFSNLIQIKPHLLKLEIGVFCVSENACTITENSNVATVAGFIKGLSICEELQASCIVGKRQADITRLLEDNIVDAILLPLNASHNFLCDLESNMISYRILNNTEINVFHYIHKQHEELADSLSTAITNTMEKGLMDPFQNEWRFKFKDDCSKHLVLLED
ncbi:MAG: hypothetical protein ACFHVJ_14450 [Aestuariibacter sp.]